MRVNRIYIYIIYIGGWWIGLVVDWLVLEGVDWLVLEGDDWLILFGVLIGAF